MDAIADGGAGAWPLVFVMACAIAVDRHRARRRRTALNRALHELRRPLQALALAGRSDSAAASPGGHLDAAIAAVGDLDAEINGRGDARRPRLVSGERLVADAAERWRSPAAIAGRAVETSWRAGEARVFIDPSIAARALDNLIANALEHGAERVRLVGSRRSGRLRITVANEVAHEAAIRSDDPRRGHGLAIVSGLAASAGGRFALSRDGGAVSAVLELPLAAR